MKLTVCSLYAHSSLGRPMLLAYHWQQTVQRVKKRDHNFLCAFSWNAGRFRRANIYRLAVTGKVSMDDVRKIMDEAALLRNIQEPPMKYVLCIENSLADLITKTRALENVEGVKFVEISLNREMLVSIHLRYSLIREEIMKKIEKNRGA